MTNPSRIAGKIVNQTTNRSGKTWEYGNMDKKQDSPNIGKQSGSDKTAQIKQDQGSPRQGRDNSRDSVKAPSINDVRGRSGLSG